jgi:RNA polymerase sigma factor (sigma-70 family)
MSDDPVRAWLSRPESLTQLKKYVATYQAPHITPDELVSACVERMLERAETFSGDVEKVSAWARRVAWSSALNVHRKEGQELRHRIRGHVEWGDDAGLNGVERETPETAYEVEDTRALMRAATSLSPHGREFVRIARGDAKPKQVGDALGLNRNTITGRYRSWKCDVRLLSEELDDASAEQIIDEVAVL